MIGRILRDAGARRTLEALLTRRFALLSALGCSLIVALAAPPAAARQDLTPAPRAAAPQVCPLSWQGRQAELEAFIRTAPIVRVEEVPIGVTRPKRAFFEPDGLCASVAWKVLPPGRPNGYWESYKSEIAAYDLDKFLRLHMVPPAVEKKWKGETGAAVLWLAPVRSWKAVEAEPKPAHWNIQAVRMKMFDNLIGNIDRNAGNLLVDAEWHLFLIDHSRAFGDTRRLPFPMTRIDPVLWERLKALDEPTLQTVLGPWLDRGAIRALLARRDRMQQAITKLLETSTPSQVFIK